MERKSEAEHPSTNHPTQHYSVFELDKNNKVVASKHYYKRLLVLRLVNVEGLVAGDVISHVTLKSIEDS